VRLEQAVDRGFGHEVAAFVGEPHRQLLQLLDECASSDQTARQELRLAAAIEKLDKYHLLILDGLSYVQKSQAETSVLFELISARYERRPILITADVTPVFSSSWS
jgi:DNA replication protein DnaC